MIRLLFLFWPPIVCLYFFVLIFYFFCTGLPYLYLICVALLFVLIFYFYFSLYWSPLSLSYLCAFTFCTFTFILFFVLVFPICILFVCPASSLTHFTFLSNQSGINIQERSEIFRKYSGNIQKIFRKYLESIQKIFRKYTSLYLICVRTDLIVGLIVSSQGGSLLTISLRVGSEIFEEKNTLGPQLIATLFLCWSPLFVSYLCAHRPH